MKHWLAALDKPLREPFAIPQRGLAVMLVYLPVSGLARFATVL